MYSKHFFLLLIFVFCAVFQHLSTPCTTSLWLQGPHYGAWETSGVVLRQDLAFTQTLTDTPVYCFWSTGESPHLMMKSLTHYLNTSVSAIIPRVPSGINSNRYNPASKIYWSMHGSSVSLCLYHWIASVTLMVLYVLQGWEADSESQEGVS